MDEEVIRHPVLDERWETSVRGGIERRAAGNGPVRHTLLAFKSPCLMRYLFEIILSLLRSVFEIFFLLVCAASYRDSKQGS